MFTEKLQFLLFSTCCSDWIITQSFVRHILLRVDADIVCISHLPRDHLSEV